MQRSGGPAVTRARGSCSEAVAPAVTRGPGLMQRSGGPGCYEARAVRGLEAVAPDRRREEPTMASEAQIFEAMKQVEDPELGVNVVDLGLLYGVEQEDDGRRVVLDMTLTSAACPLTDMIEGATNAALVGLDGIEEVGINWVWSPPWSPERMTEDGKDALRSM